MELPWMSIKKSWRDRLYDIAAKMTAVYSSLHLARNKGSMSTDHSGPQLFWRYQQLYGEITDWRQNWLESEYKDLPVPCLGCHEQSCLCFPHPNLFPCNEFSYMAAESMALLLLLTYWANYIFTTFMAGHISGQISLEHTCGVNTLERRARWLRGELQKTLTLPCFGQAISDLPGITEGRCRSLLPTWVLSQNVTLSDYRECEWWSRLDCRLNYGVF